MAHYVFDPETDDIDVIDGIALKEVFALGGSFTDFNSKTGRGTYYFPAGSVQNRPTNTNSSTGILFVFTYEYGTIQVALMIDANSSQRIYTRTRNNNGTWSSWV